MTLRPRMPQRGDSAEIVGSGRAYVFRSKGRSADPLSIELHPGDRYDLATHAVQRITGR